MPLTTNLSVSPYFDDYNEDKDYYKILFRPSVPVQVRELNQLQTMLQKQIERFGDVVLKRGTIIDGCQPTFNTSIPYIKIKDLTAIGTSINVADYDGYLLRNSSNLVSRVIDYADGLESSDPDLKTFYLKYLNSGNSGEETSYVEGSVLTAYTEDYPVFSVRVNNGSEGFSNNDSVVVLSAILVQNTTGGNTFGSSFVVGETINQPSTNATVEIVSVDTSTGDTILRVKPLTAQLAIANTRSWGLTVDDSFTASNSANEGVISSFIGSNANASLTTTNLGVVDSINLERNGSDYTVAPYVTIASKNASEIQIDTLDLEARNYKARVTVATGLNSNAVGVGYGMSITNGKIYQKGHFLNVKGQSIIIQKYANTPDALSVGFVTEERIVNNAIDGTLVDNAAGFLNENAPGAHRLSLIPSLAVKTVEEAQDDPEFLAAVKFSNGKFYSQQTGPQYNKIADELAKRTYEESGNYVLDPFQLTTVSASTMAETANTFTYVIDPGHAYIAGYRVQTQRNFAQTVPKAVSSASIANTSIELFYGNYVRVKEFAGLHAFSTASQISLRDTAAQYLSTNLGVITAPGVEIGKARVRSVVLETGVQGSSEAVYRVYLFDIKMNAGRNFRDIRSLYSDNATGLDGVADIITEALTGASSKDLVTKTVVTEEADGSAGTITSQQSVIVTGAKLYRNDVNSLLFGLPESTKAVSNIRYKYRTLETQVTVSTAGTFSVEKQTNAEWPYVGTLSFDEQKELMIVPEDDMISITSLGTAASVSVGSNTVNYSTLTATGASFTTTLVPGDHVYVNGANNGFIRVENVISDTQIRFVPKDALETVTGAESIFKAYPKNVVIPLSSRDNTTAAINGNFLNVNLDISMSATANVTVTFNQRYTGQSSIQKTTTRKAYVKIQANTHPNGVNGPWTLGHSDVFRLRAVYDGANTSGEDITGHFLINHNQNFNFYGLSEIYKRASSSRVIGADDEFLVEFDVFTHSGEGVKTINSYQMNDTLTLDELDADGAAIHIHEIPEVQIQDKYADLINAVDFRPKVVNTCILTTDYTLAPCNPPVASESTKFSVNGKKFPLPETDFLFDYEYYLPREDFVFVDKSGEFKFVIDGDNNSLPTKEEMLIYKVVIPPYPSFENDPSSSDFEAILNTRVTSGRNFNVRINANRIDVNGVDAQISGYTMNDIRKLEERIAALEYNQNLSLLEDRTKNTKISSSVDSTLERFKFGFFVENFMDEFFSDFRHQEYDASIYDGDLQPSRNAFDLSLKVDLESQNLVDGDNNIRFRYERKKVITQSFATTGPIVVPTEITGGGTPTEPVGTLAKKCVFWGNENAGALEKIFTFSDLSEADNFQCSILMVPGSAKAATITKSYPDRLEIYQGATPNGPWNLIGNSGTLQPYPWTDEEIRKWVNSKYTTSSAYVRTGQPLDLNWLNGMVSGSTYYRHYAANGDPKYWINGRFKFLFDYDLSQGRYFKFYTDGVGLGRGGAVYFYLCYPITKYEDPATTVPSQPATGKLLRTYCTTSQDLIGVYADGKGGTYEQVIRRKDKETCGYVEPPPPQPVVKPKAPPTKPVTTFEFGGSQQRTVNLRSNGGGKFGSSGGGKGGSTYTGGHFNKGGMTNTGTYYTYHKKVDGKIVATKTTNIKYTDPNKIKSLFS